VAQLDTFGDVVPPKALSAARDGAIGWVPREGGWTRGLAGWGFAPQGLFLFLPGLPR
jgi:hypothetical protein